MLGIVLKNNITMSNLRVRMKKIECYIRDACKYQVILIFSAIVNTMRISRDTFTQFLLIWSILLWVLEPNDASKMFMNVYIVMLAVIGVYSCAMDYLDYHRRRTPVVTGDSLV